MADREPRTYGYTRTLTQGQDLSGQLAALRDFGIEMPDIFVDRHTRRGPSKVEYQKLLRRLRKGDVLAVASLSALGNSAREIAGEWQVITKEREADLVVLDVPLLDTRTTPYNIAGRVVEDVVPQLLAAVVQVEQEARQRAQAAGIAKAKAKGIHTRRPAMRRPSNYRRVRESYLAHEITRREAASQLGVSLTTFDRWVKQDMADKDPYQMLKPADEGRKGESYPGEGGEPS